MALVPFTGGNAQLILGKGFCQGYLVNTPGSKTLKNMYVAIVAIQITGCVLNSLRTKHKKGKKDLKRELNMNA